MKNYLIRNYNNGFDMLDDAFDHFFRPMFYEDKPEGMNTDIKETENGYALDVELPGFDKSLAQNSLSINGKWQILDQVHIFSVPADNNSSIQLCKMLRQVWREERKKIVKINTMYQEILLLLKIKLEQISTDSIEE